MGNILQSLVIMAAAAFWGYALFSLASYIVKAIIRRRRLKKGYRTIAFFFYNIEDPTIRVKAMSNILPHKIDMEVTNLAEALMRGIDWVRSNEDAFYWNELYDRALKGETL